MKRWIALLVAIALLGGAVLSDLTWRKRKQERLLRDDVEAVDRYVDIGVILKVVRADDAGAELLTGRPRLRVIREHHFGGILDTRSNPPDLVGRSRDPVTWFCSEDQEPVILHADEDPLGQLVYGSEGAGKTSVFPMWHYLRWLEHLGEGREGGQTAPTKPRLKMARDEFVRYWPQSWYRHMVADDVFVLCDGSRIQLRSTKQQSKESGSPIQGFNWSWCGRDEGQDQTDRHEDIESRGRAAKRGVYKQLVTATAKDSSVWRTFREMLLSSGKWIKRTLLGLRSPFVWPAFWADKKLTMSPREYSRRVLAEDVGVELAVYYGWQRDRNTVTRATLTLATDVTAAIYSDYTPYSRPRSRFVIGVFHDPGNIFNTSEVVRLYVIDGVPTWVVVGELQTEQTTQRQHARQLREYLRKNFDVEHNDTDDAPKALVFIDPHGRGETKTDYLSVYGAFQAEGFAPFSPAPETGRIFRKPRIEMVNRLLTNEAGQVRLRVLVDRQGTPVAPVLVDAFETMEKRHGDDDPEGVRRKNEQDKTHGPAAVGYGLWLFEQEAITTITVRRAIAATKRAAA